MKTKNKIELFILKLIINCKWFWKITEYSELDVIYYYFYGFDWIYSYDCSYRVSNKNDGFEKAKKELLFWVNRSPAYSYKTLKIWKKK